MLSPDAPVGSGTCPLLGSHQSGSWARAARRPEGAASLVQEGRALVRAQNGGLVRTSESPRASHPCVYALRLRWKVRRRVEGWMDPLESA